MLSSSKSFAGLFAKNYRNGSIRCKFSVNITKITMPALSPTMTQGSISKWNVAVGESLKPGNILCEIETDKASVGFEIQDEGILAKIFVESGPEEIEIGKLIALSVSDEKDFKAFQLLSPDSYGLSPPTKVDEKLATVEAPQQDHSHTKTSSANVKLSPAARYIVDSQTLDVSSLTGTSKHGIISKEDIVVAMKSGKIAASSPVAKSAVSSNSAPSSSQSLPPSSSPIAPTSSSHATPPTPSPPPSPSPHTNTNTVKMIPSQNQDKFVDIPNTNMRKVIAKRLSESKSNVPHLYATIECEIDDILALRSVYKKELGVNISVNDIVIKSVAMALRDVPQANSKWNAKTSSIDASRTIDISVAVATPSGLITPIVNNADQLGVNSINAKVKELANKAKNNQLKPEEYQGGTFTVSNLGMFGIVSFSAVINPPQACILAIGGGVPRVIVPENGKGEPKVITSLTVQLSADRRVVDEEVASRFLQAFQKYMNFPKYLML